MAKARKRGARCCFGGKHDQEAFKEPPDRKKMPQLKATDRCNRASWKVQRLITRGVGKTAV